MCGARYGSAEAAEMAGAWMAAVQRAAYRASAKLAAEKGAFALYDASQFLSRPNVTRLDEETRALIARHGIRNGCLTSIAPTGTISLLAGNVSSGIEPIFDYRARRRVLAADGSTREEIVEDYAHALHRRLAGEGAPLPAAFVRAGELTPAEHLAMQAALQPHVDSSISKTVNCPAEMSFEAFKDVYFDAYRQGLKGCTTYRPSEVRGAVLLAGDGQSAPAAVPAHTAAPVGPPPAVAAPVREAGVVYMAKPLERDPALAGYTYKLKWPGSDHAIYVTVNDIERDGRRRPFEVFINTRNLEHYAWTVALTRMISAVFRRGGDVAFVAEELKAVFDPQGGHWVGGRYVPSLLAAIGEVIEGHMRRIGFLQGSAGAAASLAAIAADEEQSVAASAAGPGRSFGEVGERGVRFCPRCASLDLVREEGCWVCRACGFSRCG
jgi:ribonucleoside-diphosphate reductase alpha chain